MRHAALLSKVASGNASVPDAHQILRMATLAGAAALGLDHAIGSLVPGKSADICAVKLDDWLSQPCYDPVSHLVYVAGRENVSHVWVDGKLRIREGQPVAPVQPPLRDMANSWHNAIG
jgi:5-methylthioadenosine/S-adenosylhomocysteine deaminase